MTILAAHLRRLAPLSLCLLAACATISPEDRVRVGLLDAGLSPSLSACMARRMVDRLSLLQRRRLQSLTSLGKADMRTLSIDRFLYKVRAIDDPEIFLVTSKAAIGCAL
jgi:hypothetical protein